MIVVSDTSPLTALLTINATDLIPSAREMLQRLESEAGMYLAADIRETALKTVGE